MVSLLYVMITAGWILSDKVNNIMSKKNNECNEIDKLILDISDHPEVIASIIEQQWLDIHHSRNQDWMYWAIIAGILAGMITVIKETGSSAGIMCLLSFIGTMISLWACCISWTHWILHIKKIVYIDRLTELLSIGKGGHSKKINYSCIVTDRKFDRFLSVNGFIAAMYLTLAVMFIMVFVFFWKMTGITGTINVSRVTAAIFCVVLSITFITSYILFNFIKFRLKAVYSKV